MIEITQNQIIFDLMKDVPDEMVEEYQMGWRSFEKKFYEQYMEKWKKLPRGAKTIKLDKENIDEIIVKDFYGRDIFSLMTNNSEIFCTIQQYQRFWNAIYYVNKHKKTLMIFTF